MRTRATRTPCRDAPHAGLTPGVAMVGLWIVAGCIRPPPRTPPPIPEEPASAETVIERYNANADRMPSDVLFRSYLSAEAGFIDDIIEPRQTRPKLITALGALREQFRPTPPKKHGNMPV